jgi:hypothetical protein
MLSGEIMQAILANSWRGIASAFILLILAIQTAASFGHSDRYFPFLWYPMYGEAHRDGERLIVHHSLFAVMPDGARRRIDPATDLGIEFWRFERIVAQSVIRGDSRAIADPLRRIKARYPAATRIELEDYPAVITRDGPQPAPRHIVAVMPIAQGREGQR